jgi:DNA replication and repair protein RecF
VIIRSLQLENVRCFANQRFDLQSNFVVMQGNNGTGKTSVLESLHYACYLRSFRTRTVRDLIQENKDHCFIAVDFYQPRFALEEKITVGVGRDSKKIIRLNDEPVQGYKTLMDHYRVVTLTADDLSLISGEPDERRSFMNAAIFLQHPDQIGLFREYNRVLALRNAYLAGQGQRDCKPSDEFMVWTKLFWEHSIAIQKLRKSYLADVEKSLRKILSEHLADISYEVSLVYLAKKLCDTTSEDFEQFWNLYSTTLFEREQHWQRSLFGAHLDDFSILLDGRKARLFASRGQQKLLAYLIKIVQVLESIKADNPAVFLVDDFLTDFDRDRAQACLTIIQSLATQVILTIPLEYERLFSAQQAQIIRL